MGFMELQIVQKGRVYSGDCEKCGQTHYIHEWVTDDFNGERDGMQEGSARCPECHGTIDKDTFAYCGLQYAGRYSAPGYMDCTDWSYNANKRKLEKELREMYGDE